MSFESDLAAFMAKTRYKTQAAFVNTCVAVKESIVNGSAITGAPGQPVGQYGPGYHPGMVGGTLKASWQLMFVGATAALIATNVKYAQVIEDNVRGAKLRSTVGGFHSVKLTVAGFDRLVDAEVAKVSA